MLRWINDLHLGTYCPISDTLQYGVSPTLSLDLFCWIYTSSLIWSFPFFNEWMHNHLPLITSISIYLFFQFFTISINILWVQFLEFLLILSGIYAGWDDYSYYLDSIGCIYAFPSDCDYQCHCCLPSPFFGSSRRFLGTIFCLCNCYLYWGIICCCFCYFHCNNFSNFRCYGGYRYCHLGYSLSLPFYY